MDLPPPPPPPPTAPPSPSARYAYLVARLRNRQITMNEATELFEIQQSTLASALARAQRVADTGDEPDDTSSSTSPSATPSTPSGGASGAPGIDDAFWMGLLAGGAGAGLLAAVLKRSQEARGASAAPEPREQVAPRR